MSKRCGIPRAKVYMVYYALIDEVMESLATGRVVVFRHFGKFYFKGFTKKQRDFYTRRWGKPKMPWHVVLKFAPSKKLKAEIAQYGKMEKRYLGWITLCLHRGLIAEDSRKLVEDVLAAYGVALPEDEDNDDAYTV